MTILKILTYPDPRLYKIAKPVKKINKLHKDLIKNMTHTMYDSNGIGLAATQVDFHERIRSTYLSLSELHSERFKLVDSSKEIIEVQDQVKKILLDYLN